ncbi:MAG: MlaD family protein [Spirochaetes bacterium]|nr:MlaD family protein [Spirochaetota bacterium]
MKREVIVGIFFFVAMAILGYYTIIMTGGLFERPEEYYMTVRFPYVGGLNTKTKVRVNGVVAGEVHSISLDENNMVVVVLKMNKRFRLYANYQIIIQSEGALGLRFVSILPGSRMVNNQLVEEIQDYTNLEGRAISDTLALVSELIAENRENVYVTIKNIREVVEKINKGHGTLGKLINEGKVHDSTEGLIRELRDAIEDTREQAPVTSFIRAALTAF